MRMKPAAFLKTLSPRRGSLRPVSRERGREEERKRGEEERKKEKSQSNNLKKKKKIHIYYDWMYL
jgi:hypothetical protein